jgi:hypothetical protein
MPHIFTLEEIKAAAQSFKDSDLAKEKFNRAKLILERDRVKIEAAFLKKRN